MIYEVILITILLNCLLGVVCSLFLISLYEARGRRGFPRPKLLMRKFLENAWGLTVGLLITAALSAALLILEVAGIWAASLN